MQDLSNKRYKIQIVSQENSAEKPSENAWDILESLAGTIDAPEDWSSEHDHYLYGTPKRNVSRSKSQICGAVKQFVGRVPPLEETAEAFKVSFRTTVFGVANRVLGWGNSSGLTETISIFTFLPRLFN